MKTTHLRNFLVKNFNWKQICGSALLRHCKPLFADSNTSSSTSYYNASFRGKFCILQETRFLPISVFAYVFAEEDHKQQLHHVYLPWLSKHFFQILIDGEHKEVVSLPAVQSYLTDVWHGNQVWSATHSVVVFLGFLLCPPLWIFFSLPLGHKYTFIPYVKLISHIVSHLFFILMLVLVFMSPFDYLYNRHNPAPTAEEIILVFWVIGKFVGEVTTADERSGLGWIRVLVLVFCGIAFILHFVAFAFDPPTETEILYVRNQIFALSSLFACVQIIR